MSWKFIYKEFINSFIFLQCVVHSMLHSKLNAPEASLVKKKFLLAQKSSFLSIMIFGNN